MWGRATARIMLPGSVGGSARPTSEGDNPMEMLVGLALMIIAVAIIAVVVRTVQANMPG